jgi:hypothetical protein
MLSKTRRPTEGELAILRVLWEQGPLSVRDIQGILNQSRATGYTTVLKLIQITGPGLEQLGLTGGLEHSDPVAGPQARDQPQRHTSGDSGSFR